MTAVAARVPRLPWTEPHRIAFLKPSHLLQAALLPRILKTANAISNPSIKDGMSRLLLALNFARV